MFWPGLGGNYVRKVIMCLLSGWFDGVSFSDLRELKKKKFRRHGKEKEQTSPREGILTAKLTITDPILSNHLSPILTRILSFGTELRCCSCRLPTGPCIYFASATSSRRQARKLETPRVKLYRPATPDREGWKKYLPINFQHTSLSF